MNTGAVDVGAGGGSVVGAGGSVAAVGVVVGGVVGTVGPTASPDATTILMVRVEVLPLLDPVSVAKYVFGLTESATVTLTLVDREIGFAPVLIRTPFGTEREPRYTGEENPLDRTMLRVSVAELPGATVTVLSLKDSENGTFVAACDATRGRALAVVPNTPTDKSKAARRGLWPPKDNRMVELLGEVMKPG